jgi:hypothetical protein
VIPLFKEHKLLIQVAGHGNHTIKLLPSLTTSDEDYGWIEQAIDPLSQPRTDDRCGLEAWQNAGRQRHSCTDRRQKLKISRTCRLLRRHARAALRRADWGENRGCRFVANPTDGRRCEVALNA